MSLIVYGATCSWWDSIDKAGKIPGLGVPCCPKCGSVLFQQTQKDWDSGVAAFMKKTGDESYEKFLTWARGKCFNNFKEARAAFDKEQASA